MTAFTKNIRPFVTAELLRATQSRTEGSSATEFYHLEKAHVLGQESTFLHTKVHCLMLMWAIRNIDLKEVFGQITRIVGAVTKTAIGFVPRGNTGGSNVSPFKVMPIEPELATILREVRHSESNTPR